MPTRKSLIALCLLLAVGAGPSVTFGQDRPQLARGSHGVVTNAVALPGKARQDTLYLMGGSGDWTGRFENPDGTQNWHGWTHRDVTAPTTSHWHVSTYYGEMTGADPGPENHVAYCGDETIESCGAGDPVGGYGNRWNEWLDWQRPAPDSSQPTTVSLDYYISYDNEPDYDYLYFKVLRQEGWETLRTYNAQADNLHEQVEFVVDAYDYSGPDDDQIHLRFEFASDGAWSDEDCLWTTHGAAQLDDITVALDGILVTFDDFEEGGAPDRWIPTPSTFVGDFSQLWHDLQELDPCVDNHSWQVIFIDDGEIVPDLPGTECISWCYGPNGWIVNIYGGLAGPDYSLNNRVVSPPLAWPEGDYDGARYVFDVYRHQGSDSNWPQIFYLWGVRSVDTGNPADLESASWNSRDSFYYGGPEYLTQEEPVSDLLVAGRTHVQVALEVYDFDPPWGPDSNDGTPAPYFDNVRFAVFALDGPVMAAREIELAQDTFPERGSIDYGTLPANWCRFDMARDIEVDAGIVPGDSVVVRINSVRGGAELTQDPRIFYKIRTNPLFNGVRGDELGTPDGEGVIAGSVPGSIVLANGVPQPGSYAFDLPDTGVFYPGDQLHYYIWAEDAIEGAEFETSTLPVDISQFGNFDYDLAYSSTFSVHFLPTMFSAIPGDQPQILFWNDFGGGGGESEWHTALRHTGYVEWIDWDVYYTNGPDSGVGNGLGSRATAELLQYYDILLYSSGDLSEFTIVNANPDLDDSPDTEVLGLWFELGNKRAFFTGDDLASDLAHYDATFLTTRLGVNWQARSVREFINNQASPLVLASADNPVFTGVTDWIAYGSCPSINLFDGVVGVGATQRIAEFADPEGNPGGYLHPAATFHVDSEHSNKVVYLPYDLSCILTPPDRRQERQSPAPLAARAEILQDVLIAFGMTGAEPSSAPVVPTFAARNFPNPFNPRTTIAFTLPRAGAVTVKVFNVRGELVRTLLDEARRPAGPGNVVWAGENDQGGQVASGVYFYEVSMDDHRKIAKMTLVK